MNNTKNTKSNNFKEMKCLSVNLSLNYNIYLKKILISKKTKKNIYYKTFFYIAFFYCSL
jgi:hypothetical protein